MKKKIVTITISIAVIIILAIIGGSLFYYSQTISYDTSFSAAVKSNTVIERGESGTPLIKAETPEDIYFALGYVHAQDRPAIIEYYRGIARGCVTVLIGEEGKILDFV